jgi:transcriptional regulator with XRE-family HTH domain
MLVLDLSYIKKRRNLLGYTQQDMADALGFKDKSTYSKLENGQQKWRAEQLPDLARVLNCKIINFFTKSVSKIETNQQEVC